MVSAFTIGPAFGILLTRRLADEMLASSKPPSVPFSPTFSPISIHPLRAISCLLLAIAVPTSSHNKPL